MFQRLVRLLREGAPRAPDALQHGLRRPLALAVLMVETARADYDASQAERDAILAQLRECCDLDSAEADRVLAQACQQVDETVSLHEQLRLLNDELDDEAKTELMLWLWRIAYADGRLDPYEEARVRQLAELLYIPHGEFVRLRLQAEAECEDARGVASKDTALEQRGLTPEMRHG